MKVTTVVVGPIQTNCYLVEDAGELIVIDPGDELDMILGALSGRTVTGIVCTHYHWDHVSALAGLAQVTGAPVALSQTDAAKVDGVAVLDGHDIARGAAPAKVTRLLHEGDEVGVGTVSFTVIEAPGHTPGSICLYSEAEHVLFAGDTLFAGGSFGRTDFADGDFPAIVHSMRDKLSLLPDETAILCGHGRPTTMRAERAANPYLAQGR